MSPVPAEEMARAIKQARALFAYGSENITNQAFWLGYAEMFDRYDWFTDYLERLAQVSAADVQRAAQKYLRAERRVVGVYHPPGEAGRMRRMSNEPLRPANWNSLPGPENITRVEPGQRHHRPDAQPTSPAPRW